MKKKPVIAIIVIGDEILADPRRDTNSDYLVQSLAEAGFAAGSVTYIGDNIEDLIREFRYSAGHADILIATGGLGPTSDDVTLEAVSQAFGLNLVLDEGVLGNIEELFRRRNRFMSDSNRKQAFIPEGSTPIENPMGTAPGVFMNIQGTHIFLMPGVPAEMKSMFTESILPCIKERFQSAKVDFAAVGVTGITESELYDRIKDIPGIKESARYYPGAEGIVVKIITTDDAPVNAQALRECVHSELGDLVYSTQGENLEHVVGTMLIEKGLTLGVAESCTGGLITHRLTDIPGSSSYLLCGIVAYSNDAKHRILGVDRRLIEVYGAVSAEVAAAMSEGVRTISGADIGISATGIAGPGGGSSEKPVGLLYCGLSSDRGTEIKKLQFVEDRIINKKRMSQAVLDMVRIHLKTR
jgi:nicotinamide-nucleotide amidase